MKKLKDLALILGIALTLGLPACGGGDDDDDDEKDGCGAADAGDPQACEEQPGEDEQPGPGEDEQPGPGEDEQPGPGEDDQPEPGEDEQPEPEQPSCGATDASCQTGSDCCSGLCDAIFNACRDE